MASPAASRAARRQALLDAHKRSFLRRVSHELRTPLNAVIGFSEILACELYGPLGAPQYKEYAEHVRQSGHKLLRLVNQVLEIARLEGHALDVDPHPESLELALDDALGSLRDEIAASGARVTLDACGAAHLPLVMADPRGLRTLLVNLIQNGLSHGAGDVTVRIRKSDPGLRAVNASPSADFLGWVEIAVEDAGPGVAVEELPRLIEPFEQGEAALTRSCEGAGLGLPIVHLLCQAMGGRLALRSDTGEGFTATVTLPAA